MRRIVVKGLIGLLLLVGVGLVSGYLYLLRSLPATAGTIGVAGLAGPVEIIRDVDAVPHIFASTVPDAIYGLGYVHAQDRLWQMEFQRRIGFGRLSEVLGAAALPQDRFLRTVGFGRAAVSAWEHLPADSRALIDTYVAGVNAFISTHHGSRLPPEFTLLRFEPEPWSGADVLAWAAVVMSGCPDIGGSRASLALMAAEELGIPVERVRPVVVDTESIGFGSEADTNDYSSGYQLGSYNTPGWWMSSTAKVYFKAPKPGTYYLRIRPDWDEGPDFPRDFVQDAVDASYAYDLHVVVGSADRFAGANRYATAVKITRQMWDGANDPWWWEGPWGYGVIVASGQSFADGLAATPMTSMTETLSS
jgi:acyl-homoserine lactone acylase PvdQ